jgi:hypothetical protein
MTSVFDSVIQNKDAVTLFTDDKQTISCLIMKEFDDWLEIELSGSSLFDTRQHVSGYVNINKSRIKLWWKNSEVSFV